MKIELRLYASLARHMPEQERNQGSRGMEVAEGTTVGALLDLLSIPVKAAKIIFVNGVHAGPVQVLKEGDRVGIFPPVAGG